MNIVSNREGKEQTQHLQTDVTASESLKAAWFQAEEAVSFRGR